MYTAKDILLERENRVEYQEKLVEQFKMPIMVIRVNYPGLNKDNKTSQGIIKVIMAVVCETFHDSIHNKIVKTTAEGPIVIMTINKEPRDIKLVALEIEEKHPLGRCVDIDVYDLKAIGISREDLGLGMRKCFVCDDIAHNCVRSKKHSKEQIETFIKNRFTEYMEKHYGR